MQQRKRVEILGVLIDKVNFIQAFDNAKKLLKGQGKYFIATPNSEMLVLAQTNQKFKQILNSADLAIADGYGLVLASKVLAKKSALNERVTGIDLAGKLIAYCADNAITVGFLGAKGDVAQKAADCQLAKNKKLKIAFALSSNPDRALEDIKKASSKQTVDLLLVAYGAPKQEYFISDNLEKLPVKVAMVVGGAFDIWAGKLRRCPKIFIFLKLEWLFRLIVEPWRIKRQFALVKFGILVIKEKLKKLILFSNF
jgi:N-acetylglucosaminyldiphosphoundecaprenol N-acetyl-beta-D-mannosaminyltransferase